MSLILEALRKSEAERRRGLPPDLHAELPPPPARRARAHRAWWWLGGLLVLASATWLALASREDRAAPATATVAVAPVRSGAARLPPGPRMDPSLPRITAPAPLPAPVLPETPPAVPAPVAAAPGQPTPPTQAGTAAPPPPLPVPGPSAEPDRPLALAELDPGARDALPPLRMSMHLWNEAPAMRFAIIDGRRVSEGDTIGEVRVVRIERDGVVLAWQGRTIHLPVR